MRQKKQLLIGKRGSVIDILLILVIIGFTTAVAFLISFTFYNKFYTVAAPMLNSSNESITALDSMHGLESTFDNLFIAIIVGLSIVGYILAYMVKDNPVFIFINLLVIIIIVVVGAAISNAYAIIEADSELAATAASFPAQHFFYANLPIILTALIAGMIITMFVSGSSTQ